MLSFLNPLSEGVKDESKIFEWLTQFEQGELSKEEFNNKAADYKVMFNKKKYSSNV